MMIHRLTFLFIYLATIDTFYFYISWKIS